MSHVSPLTALKGRDESFPRADLMGDIFKAESVYEDGVKLGHKIKEICMVNFLSSKKL